MNLIWWPSLLLLLIIINRAQKLHPMIVCAILLFFLMPKPIACMDHVSALHIFIWWRIGNLHMKKKREFLPFENRFSHRHYGFKCWLNWLHRINMFTACKMLYDRWWRALDAPDRFNDEYIENGTRVTPQCDVRNILCAMWFMGKLIKRHKDSVIWVNYSRHLLWRNLKILIVPEGLIATAQCTVFTEATVAWTINRNKWRRKKSVAEITGMSSSSPLAKNIIYVFAYGNLLHSIHSSGDCMMKNGILALTCDRMFACFFFSNFKICTITMFMARIFSSFLLYFSIIFFS